MANEIKRKAPKRYSEEDFKKLPKAEQEKIIANRKAREEKLKSIANGSLEVSDVVDSTDREKIKAFNKVYLYVRPSLVVLKARKNTKVAIDTVITDTKTVLENALKMLQ